ncbi:MAG: T9SS type A sorting domain-containing protein [Saprospiraceae bacterium]|nr:T9SS type A sorting domain-containing protein [Saprospiraceae bacterium]MBK9631434.1 T9SS type A sorting domain-containing protein [Saprospiraceae bacterium]
MKPTMSSCFGVRKLCPSGPDLQPEIGLLRKTLQLCVILIGRSQVALALFLLFISFAILPEVQAQCVMACRSKGNISLGPYCEAEILPSMLLTKGLTCPNAKYRADVMDYNMQLIPTSPVITEAWIGKTVTVRVYDSTSKNSCWGTLFVEDKFAPVIECKTDTMYCNDIRYKLPPIFYDYCDPYAVIKLVDEIAFPYHCDSFFVKFIVRGWTAVDKYNNYTKVCYDTTYLRRVPIDSITFPKNFTKADSCHIECGSVYEKDGNGHPHPNVTDVPRIEGIPLWPDYSALCNVSTNYEDAVLINTSCKKKILRMWRIVEWWCGTAVIKTHAQTIEIADTEAPHIHCPYDIEASTNLGYNCLSRVYLPPIEIEDNCQDSFRVDILYPGGILQNQNGGYIDLEVGVNIVTYRVYDLCDNLSTCDVTVTVTDQNPPTMVCDQGVTVALTRDDEVDVDAEIFDEKTFDDCHLHSLLVRRMDFGEPCGVRDSVFRPYVTFCCEDAGKSVMVILRATDSAGNTNECMVEADIQDKTPPVIKCPHDYSISCEVHLDTVDLTRFGGPIYTDNCIVTMVERVDTFLNQCKLGYLERIFVITDNMGRKDSCSQKIFVNPTVYFEEYNIHWPRDTTIYSCGADIHPDSLPDPYSYPIFDRVDCSLPATFYEDHEFRVIQDTALCYKVLRKWKVMDWCRKYTDSLGNDHVPTWEHLQIIKIQNKLPPKILDDCETKMYCVNDNDCLKTRVQLTHSAKDDCTPDEDLVSGFKLDLYNNGFIDSSYQQFGATVSWDGDLPVGEHRLIWFFEDQCGNKEVCDQLIRVANCKGPTAYCLSGITVNLSSMDINGDGIPEGVVDVWANDIDHGSYQFCGNPVTVSFSRDSTDKGRRYTCDSLGQRRVEIWVTDQYTGLQDLCVSSVIVQDNNKLCPRRLTGNIAGLIHDPNQQGLSDVRIILESAQISIEAEFDGKYVFPDLQLGEDYTVSALNEKDYMDGITTLDIIQIQKHILGQKEINNPWQLMAADVTGDKKITTSDISAIRKLILGSEYKFKGSPSWRFTHSNYQFPDPSDPWYENLPQNYLINGMSGDMNYLDFSGIKMGDVSQTSWNGLSKLKERSNGQIELSCGKLIDKTSIPILTTRVVDLEGLQITLHFDPSLNQLAGIESAAFNISSANLNLSYLSEGIVLISVNEDQTLHLDAGTELFRLNFVREVDEDLRNSIYSGSDVIRSEAYLTDGEIMEIAWEHPQQEQEAEVVFGIPRPNPFAEMTVLPMDVKNSMEYNYRLFDMSGVEIFSHSEYASVGRNYIKIRKSQIPRPGVYVLKVESKGISKSFKLVVMEQ